MLKEGRLAGGGEVSVALRILRHRERRRGGHNAGLKFQQLLVIAIDDGQFLNLILIGAFAAAENYHVLASDTPESRNL